MNNLNNNFPGGSKKRVSKAGNNVRNGVASLEDLQCIEEWRTAHRAILNTFQSSLRQRTRHKKIVVAQRHKRRNTIIHKLQRFPKMELARMDDIAGCRLIFRTIDDLHSFRNSFHKARFKHVRKNENDKYDYIKSPKTTGYRGIHDVYVYNVNSDSGKHLKGLMVEIQYRTLLQHSWATAVEVIGFITESQPKFQQGDTRYEVCMSLASEILARNYENMTGTHADLSNKELVERFNSLEGELHLIRTLAGLNTAQPETSNNRNAILVFKPDGELEIYSYREATDALKELFKLEKDYPTYDIVLVKADTKEDIRMAFKNYFSDAKDFIKLLTKAKKDLIKK